MKLSLLFLLALTFVGGVEAALLPGQQSGNTKPLPSTVSGDKILPEGNSGGSKVLPGSNNESPLPGGGGNNESILPGGRDNGGKVLPTQPIEKGGGDFFRSATTFTLTRLSGKDEGNNSKATRESGEPVHGGYEGNPGGKSLWWKYTSTFNGMLTLSTRGSNFDTVLAVYVGDNLEGLTPVGYDDNSGPDETSLLTVRVSIGNTYYIAVDGYNGASGKVVLTAAGEQYSFSGPAINDHYSDRTQLAGAYVFDYGYNYNATEDDEGYYIGPDSQNVWWTWTAPASGQVAFRTAGSDFDTVLAVFRRTPPEGYGGPVEYYHDDVNLRARDLSSLITITDVVAGEVFDVAIDGFSDRNGSIIFTIEQQPVSVPPNDHFDYRLGIQGNSYAVTTVFGGTLNEDGEPIHANVATYQSLWWTWTATANGLVTVSTKSKLKDNRVANPVIAVYRGPRLSFLKTVVYAQDLANTGRASVQFEATKGETYQIAVARPYTSAPGGELDFRLKFEKGSPKISKQPTDASVKAGKNVTFSVDVSSKTLKPIKYQWQRRVGKGDWVAIKDNKTYSGAKTKKLKVSNVTAAMDGTQFRCVITNRAGKATSSVVKLTVKQEQTKQKVKKVKKVKKDTKKADKKLLGGSSSSGKLLGN